MHVKLGDTIRVHYKGTLTADGSLFDSSEGREPLEFKVGEGVVIDGFDKGVVGMAIGESRKIDIPFLNGYGPVNDFMIFEFERSQLPPDLENPEVGMILHMMDQEGNNLPVAIVELTETQVKLDANHPLAGKDLTFEVSLEEII
jgi:FKBP-type peptidyl-prolyl cis-trans isomerase 2